MTTSGTVIEVYTMLCGVYDVRMLHVERRNRNWTIKI